MLVTIPSLAILFLQNSRIQTLLTSLITTKISENLHARINIESVSLTFINRLQLKNVYIEDQQGDTLVFAGKINVTLRSFSRSKKEMTISRLKLEDAYIHFNTDTSGVFNLKFILDKLVNKNKSDSTAFSFNITKVELKNSRFHYTSEGKKLITSGVNFGDMDLRDLNLRLENFRISGDTIAYSIRKLMFNEKSGLSVKEMNADMSLSSLHMNFDDLSLITPFSNISAQHLWLSFFSFRDFSDFVNLVGINFSFNPSLISFHDLSYFATSLKGYDESIKISGDLTGQINNLKGNNILLSYQENTRMMANFNMIGLPDFKTTFLHFDIISFETNSDDLKNMKIPGGKNDGKLKIPASIAKLGNIKYSGKFTGYPDDFVAYGKFKTSLGDFSSDILLKPDTANALFFEGKLKTSEFALGSLMNQDSLVGNITMNANINGYTSKAGLYAKMSGLIDSLEINHYDYRNINLAGTLTDKVFDGSFDITDPNIKMNFIGKVNLSKENPEFAFTADVSRARPYYLHLDSSDQGYFASFLLKTNFTGKNIDGMNGKIEIVNSLFRKKDSQLQIYNFSLVAVNAPDSSRLVINSDVLDAVVSGKYAFSGLPSSFRNLAAFYFPSLEKKSNKNAGIEDNNHFDFKIKLKNIHPLVSFFIPTMDIGNNTDITGHYNPALKDVALNANTPLFILKGNEWRDVSLQTQSDQQTVNIEATSSSMLRNNKPLLENLVLSSRLHKDTAFINLGWDSQTKPLNSGKFNAYASLQRNDVSGNPIIGLNIDPSDIFYNDTLWHVSQSSLAIDSSSISIDSFTIFNKDQKFLVFGKISENPEDALRFRFKEMDMNALNAFTKRYKLTVAGYISGEASIKDPFNNMMFLSDLQMDKLFLNGEDLGTGHVVANWNNRDKKVHLKSFLGRGLTPAIAMEGDFNPKTKIMDFGIDVDKLKVNMFLPYLSFLISDLKGIATGKLTLTGEITKPDLNGTVRLMKTSFLVNYLQTRYNFSNDLKIAHSNFILKDFEAYDDKGNKGMAQGSINSGYFKAWSLDVRFETNNLAFLNTTEKDNSLFYGRIFAGGIIRISGPADNLKMDITAKSNRNSVFYIPLYTSEDVAVTNFIDWVNPAESDIPEDISPSRYEVKLKGLQMNFNLEVTPDAEVQMIFDPKVGDIIKGRGTGNLKILINTLGKFEIYGDIVIDEGDYLFTLKNLINKKFIVEKGGRISWNGDPTDANIDMVAIYSLKTSIFNLTQDASQKSKRIPVECVINMSGKLMNPTINPDINVPGADQTTQNIVKSSINTDEEMMRQFVSLLVMNNFYSQQGFTTEGSGATSSSVAGVTTSELLSNQFSSWLSQISNDFDIGVNYRPGDLITTDELEVALSTQILNDRLSISGNLDMGGNATGTTNANNATSTNNIVGDFDISFKITEKLSIKAFNRSNDNMLFQTSPYTQGVGLFYREYFNSLKELASRFKKPVVKVQDTKKGEELPAENEAKP